MQPFWKIFLPNGWRWIRTTESVANRFTVCPLWPLGNPSKKPMIGLEPITCWLQISCSANWATSAYLIISLGWDQQGSNLWPPACKADALPAELWSHKILNSSFPKKRPRRDSNPWPPPWQGGALTNWATGPKYLKMDLRGLEPRTDRLWAGCSNQLS